MVNLEAASDFMATHARLLDRLPEAACDAELVVLNGDLIDLHRGLPTTLEMELVARLADLVATWRAEGRHRIATVSAGYADGIRRSLSNRGMALVNHEFVPIAGVVTMGSALTSVSA